MLDNLLMGDSSALREAVQAELENGLLRAKLISLAKWRTRSLPAAEDLVQSALAIAIDPHGRPWDAAGPVSHVGRSFRQDRNERLRERILCRRGKEPRAEKG
jgi:hypothetical protein